MAGTPMAWIIVLSITPVLSAVGLGLGIGFGIRYGEQNYYATSFTPTQCHINAISTIPGVCRGRCFQPVWTVWYIDSTAQNVTTVCEKDTDLVKGSIEAALEEGLKYPVGSVSNTCYYNPSNLRECRVTKPDPETPRTVLIVCMAGLFPIAPIIYLVQLFYKSRCFTKMFWQFF